MFTAIGNNVIKTDSLPVQVRYYTMTLTRFPKDYETVQAVLASIGHRVLVNNGNGSVTFSVPAFTPEMTATAFVLHGLLDNYFLEGVSYRADESESHSIVEPHRFATEGRRNA